MKRLIFVFLISLVFIFIISNKPKTFNFNLDELNHLTTQYDKYNDYVNPQNIISAKQLKSLIESEDIKLIGIKEGFDFHEFIPSSQIIYIDEVSQTINGIKGFVPSKVQLESVLSRIGIEREDTIILYDNQNNQLSTRLWFILNIYGHDDVKVLDGGINAWINEDYYVVNKIQKPEQTQYIASKIQNDKIITIEEVKNNLNQEDVQFVDVRSSEEYKKGHIPGAINIPYTETIYKNKTFKTFDELKTLYMSKEISPNENKIIVYCTYGNRASHTYFVLTQLLGYKNVVLYDGSYAEYSKSGLPIEK